MYPKLVGWLPAIALVPFLGALLNGLLGRRLGKAFVSVVGVGMRSHAGVASSMFKALADKGINIQLITTSEIKTSVLIDEQYAELAVRALHTYYGLDKKDA